MHQQLVSIQLSYCRGIKKTGQSLRSTANLPCRVREHFTWEKNGLIFLQRSTVLFSCGVGVLPGIIGKIYWQTKYFSDVKESRGLQLICLSIQFYLILYSSSVFFSTYSFKEVYRLSFSSHVSNMINQTSCAFSEELHNTDQYFRKC